MKATFVELPAFERHRATYFSDDDYCELQQELLRNPVAGDPIAGTGGLRKIRTADHERGKGKRGGIRVIYFWWPRSCQFWFFTAYGKGDKDDLTAREKAILKCLLHNELERRESVAFLPGSLK